jgi:hypothetical protein
VQVRPEYLILLLAFDGKSAFELTIDFPCQFLSEWLCPLNHVCILVVQMDV